MPSTRARVVLIGPMASGKTKIGRRVANLLECDAVDTDKLVVAEHGPIADIFETQGESAFRALERAAVRRALDMDAVVSLGGGAVLDRATQADLDISHVVYLTVSKRAVGIRLMSSKRPLVGPGDVTKWAEIFEQRRPIYESLADRTYDTSRGRLDAIASDIADWVRAGYPDKQEETT